MATLPLAASPAAWKLAHEAVERGAMQKVPELAQLLEFLATRTLRTVVEIGTARGGTFYAFCALADPDAVLASIDLPEGLFGGGYTDDDVETFRGFAKEGQQLHFLRQDSHESATRQTLEQLLAGRPIDLLMIDGDHTYYGVQRDFELYTPLVADAGVIVLHDILPHTEMPECKVDLLWRELEGRYERFAFSDPAEEDGRGQWGGIGVLLNETRTRAPDDRPLDAALAEEIIRALKHDVRWERARAAERDARLRAEIEQLNGQLHAARESAANAEDAQARLTRRVQELEAYIEEVHASRGWKALGVYRRARTFVGRGREQA